MSRDDWIVSKDAHVTAPPMTFTSGGTGEGLVEKCWQPVTPEPRPLPKEPPMRWNAAMWMMIVVVNASMWGLVTAGHGMAGIAVGAAGTVVALSVGAWGVRTLRSPQ